MRNMVIMSRIGKKTITIPEKVEIAIKDDMLKIKGQKGEISQRIPSEILIEEKNGFIFVSLKKNLKQDSALWGLTRALLQNNLQGVSENFEKKLEIKGVGYKAMVEGEKTLRLEVGFSHPVKLEIPDGVFVTVVKEIITILGVDKQRVGQFAANVRKARPPEPYKGKGIRYFGEKVRKKEGKKTGAAA